MAEFDPPDLPAAPEVTFRALDDTDSQRDAIFDYARKGVQEYAGAENATHRIEFADVDYDEGWTPPTLAQEKEALLKRKSLHRTLRGTVRLINKNTGEVIEEQRMPVAHVPYLNQRGTFIREGVSWQPRNQLRLRPGIYTRKKKNGEVETHVNVQPGTGRGFRVVMDPTKGVFTLDVGQSTTRLYPAMKAMGVTDDQMKQAWGEDLYNANYRAESGKDGVDIAKLVRKLGHKDLQVAPELLPQALKDIIERAEVDEDTTELTMGERIKNLRADIILKMTQKQLALQRGEIQEDNRDSQAYQSFHSAEDFFRERLKRDVTGSVRAALWKASRDGSLKKFTPGIMNKNINSLFLGTGLMACFDDKTRVLTRRGFVKWSDITEEHELATKDSSGNVVFEKPSRLIRYYYSGDMYELDNSFISFNVTPNHRLYARVGSRHHPASRVPTDFALVEAESCLDKKLVFTRRLGNLAVEYSDVPYFEFSTVENKHGNTISTKVDGDAWFEFLGWWLAEGSAFRSGRGYTVTISQCYAANPDKVQQISELLTRLGVKYWYNRGCRQFIISNKALFDELHPLGSRDKRKVPDYVWVASKRQLGLLISRYILGDGNTYGKITKSCTIAPALSEAIVFIYLRVYGAAGWFKVNHKPAYLTQVNKPVYVNTIYNRFDVSNIGRNKKSMIRSATYAGMVYCATVSGGVLFVERNGKSHWSGNCAEEINPTDTLDLQSSITRMGESGISSLESVSRDARNVQASYIGVIDSNRMPDSQGIGVDLRAAAGALKGSDNQLYTTVRNTKTGELERVSARTLSKMVVAFPGEMLKDEPRIAVVRNDEVSYAKHGEVDYEIVNPHDMLSKLTQLVPFPEGMKAQRLLMGSRMTSQALPPVEPEAPLVQVAGPDGTSLHKAVGKTLGAKFAPAAGVISHVTADSITLQTPDGPKEIQLYNNYPFSRKSYMHNTPTVKVGDYVEPNQLLATSNFTDKDGTYGLGRNLRVAYMAREGDTIEDAWVVSESAAKKMAVSTMYKSDLDLTDIKSTQKNDYVAVYASKYKPEQYDKIDDDGVVKVGQVVQPGDPLILAFADKPKQGIGAVMNTKLGSASDKTQLWDHHNPGVVTDVVRTKSGINVTVKSDVAMAPGSKLAGYFGNKGVISKILPDEQMPILADGKPAEIIANPFGVPSRVNINQLSYALLGKVAAKTGKPYVIPPFSGKNLIQYALDEAANAGIAVRNPDGTITETETVIDPRDGRKINNIFTGVAHFMTLHHIAEAKLSARDQASYTTVGTPAKGGVEGAKRVSLMDTYSIISRGATEFLKDVKLVRGQKNEDYWRAIRNGETPQLPESNVADEHFTSLLKAAGVNVVNLGQGREQLKPMLDRDVLQMAPHEITKSATLDFDTLEPVKDGLFDLGKTGGNAGTRWSRVTLPEKIPHPMMTDAIVRMLGLTEKKFDQVLLGEEQLNGQTGPAAIEKALQGINLDRDIETAKQAIRGESRTKRDAAVRKLHYLAGLKSMGITPSELMVQTMPIIPPKFRPIVAGKTTDMIHDLNYLYHDVMEAKANYVEAKKEFGEAPEEYMTLVKAVRAVSGKESPITPKHVEQGVKGVLQYAIGLSDSPKHSIFQRSIIGTSVDTVGRSVITADGKLGMDDIGIPEAMAWKMYRPFVVRRLVREGLSATEALLEVKDQTPRAKKQLEEELKVRPVVYNRAPSLHRYAYTGGIPHLVTGDAIHHPMITLKSLGADHDGDQINIHVPVSDEAVQEVYSKFLPSKNLFYTADFETHYEPVQDYAAGLYLATAKDSRQAVQTFKSVEDAKRAYAKGLLSARTPIRIVP